MSIRVGRCQEGLTKFLMILKFVKLRKSTVRGAGLLVVQFTVYFQEAELSSYFKLYYVLTGVELHLSLFIHSSSTLKSNKTPQFHLLNKADPGSW